MYLMKMIHWGLINIYPACISQKCSGHKNIFQKICVSLTHKFLRVPSEIDVWNNGTNDNNLVIENDITKNLKKSCW